MDTGETSHAINGLIWSISNLFGAGIKDNSKAKLSLRQIILHDPPSPCHAELDSASSKKKRISCFTGYRVKPGMTGAGINSRVRVVQSYYINVI